MRRTLVTVSLVAGMLGLGTAADLGIMAAYPSKAFAQGGSSLADDETTAACKELIAAAEALNEITGEVENCHALVGGGDLHAEGH